MPQTTRKIFVQLTSAGSDTGPFDVSDSFANIIDTNVPKADLLSPGYGKTYSVNLSATYIRLQSNGLCSGYTDINLDPVTIVSTSVNLNWNLGTTIGGRLVVINNTTSTTMLTKDTNGTSTLSGSIVLSFGNSYTISGRWTSGSGNTIRYRVCDMDNSTELFYTPVDISSTNTIVDHTFTLPLTSSSNNISVTLRSGGSIVPPCV